MRKQPIYIILLLSAMVSICACKPGVMIIPNKTVIGASKIFEKDGIKITLTDKFKEAKSERGFDAYFVSDFSGVVVLKEPFALEEGLDKRSLSEYIKIVISNNGHTDIAPQKRDDLWFYIKTSDTSCGYSYCFKGTDAFWIVQFICYPSDADYLEDLFYLFAQSVEVD